MPLLPSMSMDSFMNLVDHLPPVSTPAARAQDPAQQVRCPWLSRWRCSASRLQPIAAVVQRSSLLASATQ